MIGDKDKALFRPAKAGWGQKAERPWSEEDGSKRGKKGKCARGEKKKRSKAEKVFREINPGCFRGTQKKNDPGRQTCPRIKSAKL